jgi:3-oxoadipate CoA-transferase beta subunit
MTATGASGPATVENLGRGPLGTDEIAAMVARDIPAGSYVNLGIGRPTKVAQHLPRTRAWCCTPRTGCWAWGPRRGGTRSIPI